MGETCNCGAARGLADERQARAETAGRNQAELNRKHFLDQGILAVNLLGSPGSGKTALLEATARGREGHFRIRALAADPLTPYDSDRLRIAGIPAAALATGGACHVDAGLVHRALADLDWRRYDVLFVENSGSLACPVVHDLGQGRNVVVLSVAEGEEKPIKYPALFRRADVVVVTKVDLVGHLPAFRWKLLEDSLGQVRPNIPIVPVSAHDGQGMEGWLDWLERQRRPARRTRPVHLDAPELHA